MSQVEESRRQVEVRLEGLRRALDSELGWAPRGATWMLPLLAAAVGFAVALSFGRSRRSKGPSLPPRRRRHSLTGGDS